MRDFGDTQSQAGVGRDGSILDARGSLLLDGVDHFGLLGGRDFAAAQSIAQVLVQSTRSSYGPAHSLGSILDTIVPADVAGRVRIMVEKRKDNLSEAKISNEDRVKAEALLVPVIAAAQKDESWFDAAVRRIPLEPWWFLPRDAGGMA